VFSIVYIIIKIVVAYFVNWSCGRFVITDGFMVDFGRVDEGDRSSGANVSCDGWLCVVVCGGENLLSLG
jgi:hypothetical protein